MSDEFAAAVGGVSALAEPVRRRLYLYVVAQPDPVSREQAATGAEVPHHTAKFHLDRLVDEGLLEVEYRRMTGRVGPGAGRPAKLYRRSDREVAVSLPERHYDLAGRVLARAVEQAAADGGPVGEAVRRVAGETGRELAAGTAAAGGGAGSEADRVSAVLAEWGFEPRVEDGRVVLANCPFHALAREHTALVCGMNVELLAGVLDGLGVDGLAARLDPGPDRCCVTIGQGD
jgi:predicted ArsR family transcriptional regulator